MTPIRRPCSRTARTLSFLGSDFIVPLPWFVVVAAAVERTFLNLALLFIQMIADERLHGRNEGARNHEEVMVEDAHEFEQRVVARHDLAGLDAGDVHLRQAEAASQLPLAPLARDPRLLQSDAHLLRKAFHPQRLDMPCYILSHE